MFSYLAPVGEEKRFQRLVEACHAKGLAVLPYAVVTSRSPQMEKTAVENQMGKPTQTPIQLSFTQ